jgi:hypothetical protein
MTRITSYLDDSHHSKERSAADEMIVSTGGGALRDILQAFTLPVSSYHSIHRTISPL